MANLDGGHYFLTVLAPVQTDPMPDLQSRRDPNLGYSRSHRLILANRLSLLPTGRQDSALPKTAWPSPFSLNTLNHFARFAIVDAPRFNGRISGDGLLAAVRSTQLLKAQPDDRLTTPFLLFGADFDAHGLSEAQALRRYTDRLWETMAEELTSVFQHCYGFEKVDNAAAFHDYIRKCRVETSRPFNDYWADGLKAGNMWPAVITVIAGGFAAVVGLGAWLVALAWFLTGKLMTMTFVDGNLLRPLMTKAQWPQGMHWPTWLPWGSSNPWGTAEWLVDLPIMALIVGFVTLKLLHMFGRTPFPTAPDSDLPSILKGIYLQQNFTRFAIEAQGLDEEALHARFGAFLKDAQPGELVKPTLKPGTAYANIAEGSK